MNRKLWLILPCGVVAFFVLQFFSDSSVTFADLETAKKKLVSAGYHCTSDRADGKLASGFMVTREPSHWRDFCELPKGGRVGPEWSGRVWVATRGGSSFHLDTVPDEPSSRIWGKVVAFGDHILLAEIERALRPSFGCM
jgi:hypothetical protein